MSAPAAKIAAESMLAAARAARMEGVPITEVLIAMSVLVAAGIDKAAGHGMSQAINESAAEVLAIQENSKS